MQVFFSGLHLFSGLSPWIPGNVGCDHNQLNSTTVSRVLGSDSHTAELGIADSEVLSWR